MVAIFFKQNYLLFEFSLLLQMSDIFVTYLQYKINTYSI